MKKQLLITALFFSFISVSAQQKKYPQEAIDLNNRAMEIRIHNLSNKDSIAKVLNMLDKAIALDKSYITAYGNKVNILLSEEEYDKAIKTLDEAIKYNPEQHGFYLLKAKALEEQGQSEEALAFYKKALETCENQMRKNPAVGSFLDSYFLKYCIYGISKRDINKSVSGNDNCCQQFGKKCVYMDVYSFVVDWWNCNISGWQSPLVECYF